MSDEIVYEDLDEPGATLAVYQPAPPTLFGTDDPATVIERATAAAKPLAEVVRAQKLITRIQQSEHVRVEGWTLLGSMLGVFPICVWTRKIDGDRGGWEARVEARTRDGSLVGAAEAECLRSERTWAGRDDYALRSMAQTRATSKALRQPLGFVMQLAGFSPTPAEEMPEETKRTAAPPKPTAADRKKLDDVIAELDELAPTADGAPNWFAIAEGAARRDFKHGIGALSKAELVTLVDAMSKHRDEIKATTGEGVTA